MSLYEQCVNRLGKQAIVLSELKTVQIFDSLQDSFEFAFYGRINWDQS